MGCSHARYCFSKMATASAGKLKFEPYPNPRASSGKEQEGEEMTELPQERLLSARRPSQSNGFYYDAAHITKFRR